jgi:hypothetical protein
MLACVCGRQGGTEPLANPPAERLRCLVMRRVLAVVLAALTLLAMPAAAFARPFTETVVERISETFSDEPFLCQDELYTISAHGFTVTHLTIETDDDGDFVPPLHFRFFVHAKVVAVPLDGTGPSFVGHFSTSDSENIRSVKHGDVLVETDTDHNTVVARGSDGSRVWLRESHHFTYNANRDVTVEFDKIAMSC